MAKEYTEGIVITKLFSDRQYKIFNILYYDKVRQYHINNTLNGGEKSSKGKSDISKIYAPNSLLNYLPLSFNFF